MVIILEGPNRTGKTTFAQMLTDAGFKYFKSHEILPPDKSVARMSGILDVLISMDKQGVNCVVDRFHITDRVYGKLARNEDVFIADIDAKCAKNGFLLYYMTAPVDKIKERGIAIKTDISPIDLHNAYDEEVKRSVMQTYRLEYVG